MNANPKRVEPGVETRNRTLSSGSTNIRRGRETPLPCPFCGIARPELADQFAVAIFDRYAVSSGHMLIIPRRHVVNYFETTHEERRSLESLLFEAKQLIDRRFAPDAYNVGINIGVDAGQTIPHVHLHIIPRYRGDVEDPRGGIRGVIPKKRVY